MLFNKDWLHFFCRFPGIKETFLIHLLVNLVTQLSVKGKGGKINRIILLSQIERFDKIFKGLSPQRKFFKLRPIPAWNSVSYFFFSIFWVFRFNLNFLPYKSHWKLFLTSFFTYHERDQWFLQVERGLKIFPIHLFVFFVLSRLQLKFSNKKGN